MQYTLSITILSMFFGVAIRSTPAEQLVLESVPGVPERYWFLYEPNWPLSDKAETTSRQALPFESIALERRGGLFGPPNYTVTLRRDGTAHFDGGPNAPRRGQFAGTVDLDDFGRLCFLVERFKLEKLPEDIRKRKIHGSHGWATIVRAKKVDDRKQIENWEISGCGPIELWAIQMSIDAVAQRIKWNPKQETKATQSSP